MLLDQINRKTINTSNYIPLDTGILTNVSKNEIASQLTFFTRTDFFLEREQTRFNGIPG